ncbi:methionine aminopeptidase [Thermoanaerobaculum aquaticum]|uniref:Methionine aminopeptidase n=1 Tax=Thermoanaerobaculum aquaticum TaxID=1312852 RepID=A0A062XYZ8_9BACT|nr:methionine aminopeptidase [Thermoanaerobaculum aquaticum]
MMVLKTRAELAVMHKANALVQETLRMLADHVRPGVSTAELDRLAEDFILAKGAKPAFKGYHGYPATLCTSVNDVIVHGIPSERCILKEGDIISLDCGVVVDGFYGDGAVTLPVGKISPEAQRLLQVTRECLELAVKEARPGRRLGDVSAAIQRHAEEAGFSVVREFVGHGIGRSLHEDPQVCNYGVPGTGPELRPGLVLAIEPMVNEGSPHVRVDADGWTARTEDGKLSAHFEYSVAVTENGPWVLGVEG